MVLTAIILVVTVTSVLPTPVERERRFLLDITDGAKDVKPKGDVDFPWSWDFGDGEFVVKDKDGVDRALSDARNETYDLLAWSFMLYDYSKEYRRYVIRYPNNKHLEKWQATGDTLTNLLDATDTLYDLILHYNAEFLDAMLNDTKPDALEELLNDALRNIGNGIIRIENQLSEAWPVLTTLRDADINVDADQINLLLTGFFHQEDTLAAIKFCYQKLIEAAGIDADD